jgi:hypothetical protein
LAVPSWKKVTSDSTPFSLAALAQLAAGSMPRQGNALLHEVLKEVPVVARELHDEALVVERQALRDHVDVVGRVLQPRGGERGEIRVLGEDLLDLHVLGEAH